MTGRSVSSIAARPRFFVGSLAAGAFFAAAGAGVAFLVGAVAFSLLLVLRGGAAMTSSAAFSSATFWLPAMLRASIGIGGGLYAAPSSSTHYFALVVFPGWSEMSLSSEACEMMELVLKNAPDPRVAPPSCRSALMPERPDASVPNAA